jgi:tellurite resistance protein TerC
MQAPYAVFILFVFGLLALDLGVFNRKAHAPSLRESLFFTGLWITIGLAFSGVVYWVYESHALGLGEHVPQLHQHHERTVGGGEAVLSYLTGYALEKSLALDNLFVMLFVFRALRVEEARQHRVLFLGILGALVLRGGMIAIGAAMVARFEWILYVFGALLVWSGFKLAFGHQEGPEKPKSLVWLERFLRVDTTAKEGWIVRTPKGLAITTSLLALISIELADVVFAIDSIPAIFAVTRDPFIVFTSNVMAMLGLRSLYFVLAVMADRLVHLGKALAAILVFVGIKMIGLYWDLHIPAAFSLSFIALSMLLGVVFSLRAKKAPPPREVPDAGSVGPAEISPKDAA